MNYSLNETQSYDTAELQAAFNLAGVQASISGYGETSFTVHGDTVGADPIVQVHLTVDWNLEKQKKVKREEIRRLFNINSNLPVDVVINSVNYTFNGGMESSLRIDGAYRLAIRLSETTVMISDIDNNLHVFSLDETDLISKEVAKSFRNYFFNKQSKFHAIDIASTQQELDSIIW